MFRDKVIKLFNTWKRLQQNHHQTSQKSIEKRNHFKDEVAKLFDLARKDAVEEIKKDRLRSEAAKEEDIDFLWDQRSTRVQTMSVEDKKYSEAVERKVKRDTRSVKSTQENKSNGEKDNVSDDTDDGEEVDEKDNVNDDTNRSEVGEKDNVNDNHDGEISESDDDSDKDFVYEEGPKKKKKKTNSIVVEIPRNIAELTAENAVRRGISATAHASIIANVVNVGGGDINELPISKCTMWRAGRKSVKDKASIIRQSFAELNDKKTKVIHFDGKIVEELTNNVVKKNERMAVLVSSPDMEFPQLLGVPAIPTGSGADQEATLTELIASWGIKEHIVGMGFDTTASNTGTWSGACILFEKSLGYAILWLACRRHVSELHIKHVALKVL